MLGRLTSKMGCLAVEFPDIMQVGTGLLKGIFLYFLEYQAAWFRPIIGI